MATRQYRLNEFDQVAPPSDLPLELLCEDNRGTYVLPYLCLWSHGTWRNTDTGSTIIRISMDGRGRWMDNVFIERLWRSLKYECVFMNAFETGSEARAGIGRWIEYYNTDRPHSAFAGRTPDEVYATQANEEKLAA
jgi:putative transposase